uniref:Uncharacterized protein n=1 Tax=Meloidogyne enterolobii TaxID=390850 RepID=A0A6V7US25_MELEN|nr:unnamed protein product [Meloidogyne enterolobii]
MPSLTNKSEESKAIGSPRILLIDKPIINRSPLLGAKNSRRSSAPFSQISIRKSDNIRISQSSSAVVDSMISEGFLVSSSSTTVPTTKMLQDSGYRSTISNSNFEEEMLVIAEKERKERRRQRRKTGLSSQQKPKEEGIMTVKNKDNNSSSVPAFLRRTCSNAANGINAIKPSGWIGAAIMRASTSDDNVKSKSTPRRTQSIGSSTTTQILNLPPTFLYSTGWMVEADLSSDDSNNEKVQIFGGNNCGGVEGFYFVFNFFGG